MSSEQEPEGYRAPCLEALWRPNLLGGVPPWTHWHWAIWLVLALVPPVSLKPFWIGSLTYGALLAASYWDPEWPRILRNLFRNSGELDP